MFENRSTKNPAVVAFIGRAAVRTENHRVMVRVQRGTGSIPSINFHVAPPSLDRCRFCPPAYTIFALVGSTTVSAGVRGSWLSSGTRSCSRSRPRPPICTRSSPGRSCRYIPFAGKSSWSRRAEANLTWESESGSACGSTVEPEPIELVQVERYRATSGTARLVRFATRVSVGGFVALNSSCSISPFTVAPWSRNLRRWRFYKRRCVAEQYSETSHVPLSAG